MLVSSPVFTECCFFNLQRIILIFHRYMLRNTDRPVPLHTRYMQFSYYLELIDGNVYNGLYKNSTIENSIYLF